MLFFRSSTDKTKTDCTAQLLNSHAGVEPSPVWIVGGSPNLAQNPSHVSHVNDSSIPKFSVNYGGRGGVGWTIKPNFWTSFDGTARFHKSIFADGTITKFVRDTRTLDLVPNSGHKLCDFPSTYFFPSAYRGYTDFFDPTARKVNHSLDSFIQAIDIAFLLGFRTFYCVGCEMRVRPSEAQVELARSAGVEYEDGVVTRRKEKKTWYSDLLRDFVTACVDAGLGKNVEEAVGRLESVERERQYGFDEQKPLASAISSDAHYWERVQYLRLSRKCMALNGVRFVSCTPGSRLNDWFPYEDPKTAWERHDLTDERETTRGAYEKGTVERLVLPIHQDVSPYGWADNKKRKDKEGDCKGCKKKPVNQVNVEVPEPEPEPGAVRDKIKTVEALQGAVEHIVINERF